MAATIQEYWYNGHIPSYWTGWGGDLATSMADISKIKDQDNSKNEQDIAYDVIGHKDSYSFSKIDIESDGDAIYFAKNIKNIRFDKLLESYYKNTSLSAIRKKYYMQDMSGKNTLSDLKKEIMDQITGVNGFANIPFGVGLYKKKNMEIMENMQLYLQVKKLLNVLVKPLQHIYYINFNKI